MTILDTIVASKKEEIKKLYATFDVDILRTLAAPAPRSFYGELAAAAEKKEPFFITEFKRKSPSEGWIDQHADLPAQITAYSRAGARAISVLTDEPFFGGTYNDLRAAYTVVSALPEHQRPLLLQKDFVLDPIQIYLARQAGADMILLIAAILPPERLLELYRVAESLKMGVIVEVHDAEELDAVQHIDFPVLGVNNRDLKTFRTALNRVNVLAKSAGNRFVIAESGLHYPRDFRIVRNVASGFLIGTSLMRKAAADASVQQDEHLLEKMFAPQSQRLLLKACGIRTADLLRADTADWVGVNFSPVSKRRMDTAILEQLPALPDNAVAVFYKNSMEEIAAITQRFPFKTIQLYAGDVTPEQVRALRKKVILAVQVRSQSDLDCVEDYASDVDLFILDGAVPGSGQTISATIPTDFPYPFLLAGGLHAGNLDRLTLYPNCIGADIASGIETDGRVDEGKIQDIVKYFALS
jgi:indole-3-glycerol phosphate synthase/phosphoribosylanthranilate isomerase